MILMLIYLQPPLRQAHIQIHTLPQPRLFHNKLFIINLDKAYGMYMLSLSDENNQMVFYPKLGQILDNLGSIMSALQIIIIIIQMIYSIKLEDKILFLIISSYFQRSKNIILLKIIQVV
ncbi:hypothetical protein pb186bvf_018782 [Paramecium bursaria]